LLLAALALASILTSSAAVAMLDSRQQPLETRSARPSLGYGADFGQKAQEIPIWARIPRFVSGESRKTVWQKPIVSIGELDVGPYLATLLEKIGNASNGRGKVAVVTSVETGDGASTVARSLNQASLNSGKISVLIQVVPDSGRLAPSQTALRKRSPRPDIRRQRQAAVAYPAPQQRPEC